MSGRPKTIERRFRLLHELGCIACLITGAAPLASLGPLEIHHILHAGKRIGDEATIPLHRWCHQGVSSGLRCAEMLARFGPSFHKHTRAFRARYGDDAAVLSTVNRLLLEISR